MSFDDYARNWDTDKRINRARIIANEIEKVIQGSKEVSAMEFGCGTGLISFNLYDKLKKITLIDSSKGMIDILNSKIKRYKVKNMITKCQDILNEVDRFDIIYNSMVLHHINNTEEIIKKFYELLNNDGYLIIVDLNKEDGKFHKEYPDFNGHNGFEQEELQDILRRVGFKNVGSKTIYYDTKIIDGECVDYSLFLIEARKF